VVKCGKLFAETRQSSEINLSRCEQRFVYAGKRSVVRVERAN
jgi:hypothetical protein